METTWEVDYGDLKLEKAIGRGNFGVVWKGLFEVHTHASLRHFG